MSPSRDLKDKYGGKTRDAINRAIRAECPGGSVALDHVTSWYQICNRLGWGAKDGSNEPLQVTAYRHLLETVDAMESDICKRYDIPERPRDDLKR